MMSDLNRRCEGHASRSMPLADFDEKARLDVWRQALVLAGATWAPPRVALPLRLILFDPSRPSEVD